MSQKLSDSIWSLNSIFVFDICSPLKQKSTFIKTNSREVCSRNKIIIIIEMREKKKL